MGHPWNMRGRREGISMFAIGLIVLGAVIYMASPGIFHNAARTVVNTVFDALGAATGNKVSSPIDGDGLREPPRPPGEPSAKERAAQARAKAAARRQQEARRDAARKQASRTP